jgi:hypothetical protein
MFLFIEIIVIINLNGKDAFKTDCLGWNGLDAWQGLPCLSLAQLGMAPLGSAWLTLAQNGMDWMLGMAHLGMDWMLGLIGCLA